MIQEPIILISVGRISERCSVLIDDRAAITSVILGENMEEEATKRMEKASSHDADRPSLKQDQKTQ